MTLTADAGAPRTTPEVAAVRHPQRWALVALLVGTAVLYIWDLSGSGWANTFYSAAAQAGSQSWKAFLFGSSDAANSMTVDKPPLSLWPAALAVRVFGLSPWSILVPQALMGVASVALLWDTVRRGFGESAGLAAGLTLAVTPVAVTIFRYNNPDALLALLMIAAVWAMLRAVDDGRTRWLVMSGICVGLGYLTKQLQVALVLPALTVTYLVAGPPKPAVRFGQLVAGLGAALAAAGWWVLLVELWPPGDRPWIGGTQHNSMLELTLGYNGLGRLSGNEPGSTAALGSTGRLGPHPWGVPGVGRLFQPNQIGGIGWLLPAALLFLVVLLVRCAHTRRTDAERAQVLAWGGWLLCTAAVFSFMAGIFHPYYTVALAPPVAALVGICTVVCWRHRSQAWARAALTVAVVLTAATAWHALHRLPHYLPWLKWAVLGCGVALAVLLVLPVGRQRDLRPLVVVMAGVLGLAGPAAYSVNTVLRGNTGALPTAGPPVRMRAWNAATGAARARITSARGPAFLLPAGAPGRPAHIPGCSLLEAGTPAPAVIARLDENAESYSWVAATVGSMCAAGYQLATGHPVMPVGGFNATDPAPTPAHFMRLVLAKRIHYFIVSNPLVQDRAGHLNDSALIQLWVQRNFTPVTVDRVRMYDLTR